MTQAYRARRNMRVEVNPWRDNDAPQPALAKPAWYVPGAVVRPDVPVRRDRLEIVVARTRRPSSEERLTYVVDAWDDDDAEIGIVTEAARVRGATRYRRIRTVADGDDPVDFGDLGYRMPYVPDNWDAGVPGKVVRKHTAPEQRSMARERAAAARRALAEFDSSAGNFPDPDAS